MTLVSLSCPLVTPSQCIYCGSTQTKKWFSDIRDRLRMNDMSWSFDQCADCGSALLSPRPDAKDLQKFYPETYCFEPDNTKNMSPVKRLLTRCIYIFFYQRIYRAQAKSVVRLAGMKSKGATLLDFGCGSGLLLKELLNFGFKAEGAELRSNAAHYVANSLHIPCHEIMPEEEAFGLPQNHYDIITMFHVLEHLADPQKTIHEASKLLKENGKLIIAVPIADSVMIQSIGKRSCVLTDAPRHVSAPSQQGVATLLNSEGFSMQAARPDSLINCAAMYALSLLPGSTTSTSGGFMAKLSRMAAAAAIPLSFPWVAIENYILKRPVAVIFSFAKKRATLTQSRQHNLEG